MADLDGLKKRVELIDLRLKTAHNARERESAALMETWEQIRDRFQDQSAEIIKLRGQISDLEDSRDDLLKMVHGLLAAVEGGLDNMADETVPHIKSMAGQLLSQSTNDTLPASAPISETLPMEEAVQEPAPVAPAPSASTNFHDELLTSLERTIENAREENVVEQPVVPDLPVADHEAERSEPASLGIRDLVSRIENAVGEDFLEPAPVNQRGKPEGDDELTRDLREIEALRGELHGLRQRISGGAL